MDKRSSAVGANLSAAENDPVCYRLEPEKRLVPRFDACCIAQFQVARPGKMGMRVLDDCCEEHIM